MKNTLIEWADYTFNPWIGCAKVSPGCANCYAENQTPVRVLRRRGVELWGNGCPRHRTSIANWRAPLSLDRAASAGYFVEVTRAGRLVARGDMRKLVKANNADGSCLVQDGDRCVKVRPRVFCASLADWLDDEVAIEWLVDLLDLIRRTPNLDWLLLTKRPQNWRGRLQAAGEFIAARRAPGDIQRVMFVAEWLGYFAPTNVWIGTTVEDQQRAAERIPKLLRVPARVRFLSCEPLLGPLEFSNVTKRSDAVAQLGKKALDGIHWVICGGESGPKARPMHPDWARSLRDQCTAAGVPFFFKQWGEFVDLRNMPVETHVDVRRGRWVAVEPRSVVVHRVGKRAAGRQLDGCEYNDIPAAP